MSGRRGRWRVCWPWPAGGGPAGGGVLGEGRVGQVAELFEGGLLVFQPQLPATCRCRSSSPRISSARLTRATRRPRPEPSGPGWRRRIGQPVRGGPNLATHPAFLPRQDRLVCAEPGKQGADRVTVADHHAVDVPHLAGLRTDPEPPRRTDPAPTQPPGPGQVTSSEDDRPGSVSEPCARNAPRQAATASQDAPDTTAGGSPRTGRPRLSTSPVCRASASPSRTTRTTYFVCLRMP